jgi:transposase
MFNVFNQSAADARKVPGVPLTNPELLPDSERNKQSPPLDPAYKPFDQESALRQSPYKPYADKPGVGEPPYKPYEGM